MVSAATAPCARLAATMPAVTVIAAAFVTHLSDTGQANLRRLFSRSLGPTAAIFAPASPKDGAQSPFRP